MKTKKIPLEQLSAYFPYGVKAEFWSRYGKSLNVKRYKVIGTVGAIYDNSTICCYDTVNSTPTEFKLLLHPINLQKSKIKSEYNLFEIWKLYKNDISIMPLCFYKEFLRCHYDIFGLIEKGLAKEIKL